jgi:hypothetical protein
MIRKLALTGASAVVVAGFAFAAFAAPEPAGRGPGSERFQRNALERCERFKERLASIDRGFTAEQLRDIAQGRLAARDMTNLKVGKVTEKDGVVTLEIVTKEGSLVETRQISTKTGLDPNVGANCEQNVQRRAEARRDGDRPGDRDARGRGDMHRGPGGPGGPGFGGPGFGGPRGPALGDLPGGGGRNRDLALSADDVKKLAEAALVLQGNDRLKVGKVTEKDADTYAVDIVTRDNSLVVTREVNKHNGRWSRS